MKTPLQIIFDELSYLNKVDTQYEFGEKLGYKSEGYISTLLKSNNPIPYKMQKKLNEVFGISMEWMQSEGREGDIFTNKTHGSPQSSEFPQNQGIHLSPTKIDQTMINELIRQLRVKDEQISKKEEQIDRLIAILEHEKGIFREREQVKNA